MIPEDGAAAKWAEGLPEELAAYSPTDYVLEGVSYGSFDFYEKFHGIGTQGANQSQGILACAVEDENWTVYFDSSKAEDYLDDVEAFVLIVDPDEEGNQVVEEEGFEPNSGVGDVWGQNYDGEIWHIWSYNGEDGSESWEEGALNVFYIELTTDDENNLIANGFTAELDLVTAGAANLVATATAAFLVLAMM